MKHYDRLIKLFAKLRNSLLCVCVLGGGGGGGGGGYSVLTTSIFQKHAQEHYC